MMNSTDAHGRVDPSGGDASATFNEATTATDLAKGAAVVEPSGRARSAPFADTGGTRVAAFNESQLRSVLACVQPHLGPAPEDAVAAPVMAAMAALQAFQPRDGVEGMIAAQAVAAHHAAMECLRLACEPAQSPEVASRLRRDAAAMSRTFGELLAALDRRRGKTARQVVRVERVTVQAGAQAIVGVVGSTPHGEGGG
jgi:hypothetical protein